MSRSGTEAKVGLGADWRASSSTGALVGLAVAGIALRAVAMASWWPVSLETVDSWPYAHYAANDLLGSPQHPPGYSVLLAGLGLITRSVPVFVILQQLAGIASALVLFAAVRRMAGSAWVALVPAVVVLLGADQIYLEHAIMSESPFLLLVAVSLYAAVKALDDGGATIPWAVAAGTALGMASLVRSAGTFMILTLVVALAVGRSSRLSPGQALAAGAATVIVLGAGAGAHAIVKDRLVVAPSPGWHLYSHAAQYADCGRFEPPAGTARLCERQPPEARPGSDHYLWNLGSPGHRVFGAADRPLATIDSTSAGVLLHDGLGQHDDELGAFARAAILAQPLAYARTVARDLLRYWVPDARRGVPGVGADLSPSLDFARASTPETTATTKRGMRSFFAPFEVVRRPWGIGFLHDYQRVFRFGATLLSISTLLILAGLLAGPSRARIGILLFGGSGFLLLVPPVVAGTYSGRYTVPAAGLIVAGASIAAQALSVVRSQRRG